LISACADADDRFAAERLSSLVRTLELTNIDEHYALQKVAAFGTLIATYEKGFLLILEPYETEHATVPNPIFHTVYVSCT
jgi:DNA excision repair protein ERCC-2